ncbi:hypothetical protein [Bifidobacterium commune]|uniref:hypothetical protein n=1 Tax=Bifidobacterium commune TaxID=1505727 RepID=UPI0022772281|nr:hypothetical protein [Bifidobacterium commune]
MGTPKEISPGEQLVAVTPKTAVQLGKLGYKVMPETGTCKQTGFLDDNYQQAGATIGDATEVWNADIVASVNAPTSEQISLMKPGPY